jgi:dTDP-4-amino-4,6-dideoxygalactose transaminase
MTSRTQRFSYARPKIERNTGSNSRRPTPLAHARPTWTADLRVPNKLLQDRGLKEKLLLSAILLYCPNKYIEKAHNAGARPLVVHNDRECWKSTQVSMKDSPIRVPFLDLKAQYQSIRPEIDEAIARVLDSCQFVLGSEVAAFEKEFATYCGAAECIALNSGTSALHLALLAAGVGPGDEVITVGFTFVASVAAVVYADARPVLVDIDPRSFTIDPAAIEAVITPRTKAILPVHLYGQPADMDPIMEVARRHKVAVIEDAAQAHGAKYKGRPVGSIGDIACFSFYPTKNLGAYGEGGAITANSAEYARTIRMLRDWGQDRKYHHVLRGYNYRMEGLQGAILRVKLRHLERWTEARRAVAAKYDQLLAESEVERPSEMPWARHVYHVYTLRTDDRDALQAALQEKGIQTAIHYPVPAHLQPAYAELVHAPLALPQSEKAAVEVLSLPLYPEMTDDQIQWVTQALTSLVTAR